MFLNIQVKKNAVEVYLDDIFPNFSHFDEDLRMSHLTSLRSSVMPLLEAYADKDTQVFVQFTNASMNLLSTLSCKFDNL